MICHPFRSEPFCTVRRARRVVASLVAASIAFNLPKFFEYRTVVMPTIGSPTQFLDYVTVVMPTVGAPTLTGLGAGDGGNEVVFTDLTEFGRSRQFKELYHSWLYIVFVFGLPFAALVVLNSFLVHAVRVSRLRSQELGHQTKVTHQTTHLAAPRPLAANVVARSSSCLLSLVAHPPASVQAPQPSGGSGAPSSSVTCVESRAMPPPPPPLQPSPVSKRIDTTVMLIGVVVIFIVCQFPALVSRTLWAFEEDPSAAFTRLPMYTLNEVANFLVLLNSSVNIVPYYFFGRRFRRQFLALFCPRCSTSESTTSTAPSVVDRHHVRTGRLRLLSRRRQEPGVDGVAGCNQALTEMGASQWPCKAHRKQSD
jgi:hypothetical protein